jgi:hypothetical protein
VKKITQARQTVREYEEVAAMAQEGRALRLSSDGRATDRGLAALNATTYIANTMVWTDAIST